MAHLGAAVILFEQGGDAAMVAAILGAVERQTVKRPGVSWSTTAAAAQMSS